MKKTTLLLVSALLLIAASQTGCMGALEKAVVLAGIPTYEELKDQIPPIPAGMSRLIVYYPFDPGKLIVSAGTGISQFWVDDMATEIKLFGKMRPAPLGMLDKQFMYFDLKPGEHKVTCRWGRPPLYPKQTTPIETMAGKTSYARLQLLKSPQVVPENEALKALQNLKYISKDPPQSFKLVAKK